jgi:hypothetical protein
VILFSLGIFGDPSENNTRVYFSHLMTPDLRGIPNLTTWLRRRHGIRVLMADSIEAVANAPGERTTLLRASEQLQAVAETLGLCLVAVSHSMSIYRSLRKGSVPEADMAKG